MSSAKFTLFGCERYFNNINQSLFDNLNVPEGLTKSTLTDNILLRGGEFEVMYGDPDFLRAAVGAWSNKWMPTMQRWVDALAIEYNPLENYDRMEDWTDNTARSDASTQTGTSNRSGAKSSDFSHHESENSSDERSEASNNEQSSTINESAEYSQSDAKQNSEENATVYDRDKWNSPPTHTMKKSAYDEGNSYSPLTQEEDTGKWQDSVNSSSNESSATTSDSTGHTTNDSSGSSSSASSGSAAKTATSNDDSNSSEAEDILTKNDSSSAMNNDSVHSGRVHGNIGVTTSQQMLQQELDLGYWNIYEKLTELFLQEFAIPVYS